MKSGDVSRLRSLKTAVGAAAILVALIVSNSGLEQAFGRAPHSLSWGPSLHSTILLIVGLRSNARRALRAPDSIPALCSGRSAL